MSPSHSPVGGFLGVGNAVGVGIAHVVIVPPQERLIHLCGSEREFFIVNLLVQIHLSIEMILVDRPCAMEV